MLAVFMLFSCASGTPQGAVQVPVYSENSITLDAAISEAASYLSGRLPDSVKLAIVSFEAETGGLSDYVFGELWNRFEGTGKFVMVDRRNLDRIDDEIKYQLESGKVDDALAVSITRQYGADVIVYGQMKAMGSEYRMVLYATDVEKAASSQRVFTVRPDERLSALLTISLDDQIERAVAEMARSVNQKTTIAVGRISYADTQTVSGLSAYLKNSISASAQKQRSKFQVASDNESADFAVASRGLTVETPVTDNSIQAVVLGNFSPLDRDAEVSVRLVSTGTNKVVLASSQFIIPAAELERRKLSLLPQKDQAVISKAEFEAKQKAIDPYAGKNNKWAFTVSPDKLDGAYYNGEYMSMRIYSARDCYFRVVQIDVNGMAQVIYPTAAKDNNFIRGGETRRIPDNTRYRMGPPFGEEYILVAAYDRPFTAQSSGQGDPLSIDSLSRGMVVEADNHAAISPSATAKFSYTILPNL